MAISQSSLINIMPARIFYCTPLPQFVLGAIDHTHAAIAEFLNNAIVAR